MKGIIGFFLFIVAVAAIVIFIFYKVNFIWIVGVIVLGIAGFQFTTSSTERSITDIERQIDQRLEKLKATGEKIEVEFDHCIIKDSSYTNEVIDERMSRFGTINLDYGKVIGKDFVGQSVLIYYHKGGDKSEKFIQGFQCSADSLKFYVLNHSVILYADPFDRSRYFFDLKID